MNDRRSCRRWSRRVKVRLWRRGAPDEVVSGYTTNLSEQGAFIETSKPPGTGARLQIEFATDKGGFVMEAQVTRSLKSAFELRQVRPSGIGVRFVPVRELLAEILPMGGDVSQSASKALAEGSRGSGAAGPRDAGSAKNGPDAPTPCEPPPSSKPTEGEATTETKNDELERASSNAARFHPAASPEHKLVPRPSSDDPSPSDESASGDGLEASTSESGSADPSRLRTFRIRFRDVDRLSRVWQEELQYGGLFIPTEKPLALDSRLSVQVFLPGCDEPIESSARVVLAHQSADASQPNLLAGMGIRLSHPEPLFARIRTMLAEDA